MSIQEQKSEDQALVNSRESKIELICEQEGKNISRFDVQSIRVKGVFWGTILISKHYFYYLSACCETPHRPDTKFVDKNANAIGKKVLCLQWDQVDEIMKRKVVNIFQGIDITTHEKKVYTFNMCSETKADEFICLARGYLQELNLIRED